MIQQDYRTLFCSLLQAGYDLFLPLTGGRAFIISSEEIEPARCYPLVLLTDSIDLRSHKENWRECTVLAVYNPSISTTWLVPVCAISPVGFFSLKGKEAQDYILHTRKREEHRSLEQLSSSILEAAEKVKQKGEQEE